MRHGKLIIIACCCLTAFSVLLGVYYYGYSRILGFQKILGTEQPMEFNRIVFSRKDENAKVGEFVHQKAALGIEWKSVEGDYYMTWYLVPFDRVRDCRTVP